jgi:molybdopterin-guanine dinucleotide biosynthesis protein A
MGANKAFLPINKRTFLEEVADCLESAVGVRATIVVSDRNHEEFRDWEVYFRILKDSITDLGPVSGFHAALNDNDCEFTAIAAIDMPMLHSSALQVLLERLEESEKEVVCLRLDGTVQPLPSIFRTLRCREVLQSGFDAKEIFSPSFLIEKLDALILDPSELRLQPDILMNINEPADLRQLEQETTAQD